MPIDGWECCFKLLILVGDSGFEPIHPLARRNLGALLGLSGRIKSLTLPKAGFERLCSFAYCSMPKRISGDLSAMVAALASERLFSKGMARAGGAPQLSPAR